MVKNKHTTYRLLIFKEIYNLFQGKVRILEMSFLSLDGFERSFKLLKRIENVIFRRILSDIKRKRRSHPFKKHIHYSYLCCQPVNNHNLSEEHYPILCFLTDHDLGKQIAKIHLIVFLRKSRLLYLLPIINYIKRYAIALGRFRRKMPCFGFGMITKSIISSQTRAFHRVKNS